MLHKLHLYYLKIDTHDRLHRILHIKIVFLVFFLPRNFVHDGQMRTQTYIYKVALQWFLPSLKASMLHFAGLFSVN